MAKIPDAVILPTGTNVGDNSLVRSMSVVELAEKLLDVDLTIGERAHCRTQHTGDFFCTKSLEDTIAFPKNHRHEGCPRYNWVEQPDGSSFGYLVPGALKPKPALVAVLPEPEVTEVPDNA